MEKITYDFQPAVLQNRGDGAWYYRWGIEQVQVGEDVKYKCHEVLVWETITSDGEITCYMPANTFSVGGKLFIKVITHTPDTNFADGSYDESITIDTKYLMQ